MKLINLTHIKLFFAVLMLFMSVLVNAQVGLNTDVPQAALDIDSSESGLLIPRIALNDLTTEAPVTNPNGLNLVDGTMIWNTGTGVIANTGYYFWENSRWNRVSSDSEPSVYFGKLMITATGSVVVEGIPFEPRSVEFMAVNRVQNYNDGAYRSDTNNSNDIRMAGGMTMGYAQVNGVNIDQQVIANGFNGSSINNIGTYSSDSHCIAAFFVNNNGEPIHDNGTASNGTDTQDGLISASLSSFDENGFTLNVDHFLPGSTSNNRTNQIVVIFKAYR